MQYSTSSRKWLAEQPPRNDRFLLFAGKHEFELGRFSAVLEEFKQKRIASFGTDTMTLVAVSVG